MGVWSVSLDREPHEQKSPACSPWMGEHPPGLSERALTGLGSQLEASFKSSAKLNSWSDSSLCHPKASPDWRRLVAKTQTSYTLLSGLWGQLSSPPNTILLYSQMVIYCLKLFNMSQVETLSSPQEVEEQALKPPSEGVTRTQAHFKTDIEIQMGKVIFSHHKVLWFSALISPPPPPPPNPHQIQQWIIERILLTMCCIVPIV